MDIPFVIQSYIFQELAESKLDGLAYFIEQNWDEILRVAQDRHREGYLHYGSGMYEWTAKRRSIEVIEELADAVVYMTSGVIHEDD